MGILDKLKISSDGEKNGEGNFPDENFPGEGNFGNSGITAVAEGRGREAGHGEELAGEAGVPTEKLPSWIDPDRWRIFPNPKSSTGGRVFVRLGAKAEDIETAELFDGPGGGTGPSTTTTTTTTKPTTFLDALPLLVGYRTNLYSHKLPSLNLPAASPCVRCGGLVFWTSIYARTQPACIQCVPEPSSLRLVDLELLAVEWPRPGCWNWLDYRDTPEWVRELDEPAEAIAATVEATETINDSGY